jgi:uncharacterized protein (DUF2236 family)
MEESGHLLKSLRSACANPLAGLFGPQSMFWRVDRESAMFLGAGRALLLQLAHPWVAAAVADHSRSLADPLGRFHRTFDVVFTMVFGTVDQALAAARRLHRHHASVSGILPNAIGPFPPGTPYRANDPAALRWVHATLVETAILSHDLVLPPLSAEELQRYYAESLLLARLFGIPLTVMPQDWRSFLAYNRAMRCSETLTVSSAARVIAKEIFTGAGIRWLRTPRWYRDLTAHMLPMRIREAYGLSYGAVESRSAERAMTWLRRGYTRMPRHIRYVGPYQEAMTRLSGRNQLGFTTRLLNRFWIGRESMTDNTLRGQWRE